MSYKNSIRLPPVEATPCGTEDRFTFGAYKRLWDAKSSIAIDERKMWRAREGLAQWCKGILFIGGRGIVR